jgi:hypothetical protein
MRTLILLPFLLVFPALSPRPANGAERTWTIARDVYTAEAELVAVRGNLAYLRMDGRVEEIPLERLSALDQQHIASLSLAPILPGPVAELPGPAPEAEVVEEEMPLPGEPDAPAASQLELNAPDLAPAYGGSPNAQLPQSAAAYRVDQYGRVPYSREMGPQPGVAANYLAPFGDPRAGSNPSDRRYRRPPQQGPNNLSAKSQRNDDDDDRPGLISARARRTERQRAAAARSR